MARARDLIRVIGINDAVYPCWFADIAYACDAYWWRFHGPLPGFAGQRLALEKSIPHDNVGYLQNTGKTGFDPDLGSLRGGGNSGYQAIHLAAHLAPGGRAVLVGFDMHGLSHWFGEHPRQIRRYGAKVQDRISDMGVLASELALLNFTVVNATPRSALRCFPSVDLEVELAKTGE